MTSHDTRPTYAFFAPCPTGVEPLLADELRGLGVRGVRPQRSGVLFAGPLAHGYRALVWTRLASRVLLSLAEVDSSTTDSLYDGIAAIPWEDHLLASGTLSVDATGTNASLRNTQFTAVRVKDGIADRFRQTAGKRPSVDTVRPDLRVNVAVRGDRATVSIDLAGQPLHRRGYRVPGVQVEAPMKETLAAAVLAYAGWPQLAKQGAALVDPLCGSGTIAVEGALWAGDVAPGLLRPEHPVERWLGHDAEAWARLIADCERRRERGLARLGPMRASDRDARAVELARECVRRAGLEGYVEVEQRELTTVRPPETGLGAGPEGAGEEPAPGLLATNPPWGERIGDRGELPHLYAALSKVAQHRFTGWTLAVVSPDPRLQGGLRMTPDRTAEIGSGKGRTRVTVFTVGRRSDGAAPGRAPKPSGIDRGGAVEFANRLHKMSRHLGKWARRSGISSYRLYDADLPDYAVAIDLYGGVGPDEGTRWAHIAEYAPPPGVDPLRAEARLDDVLAVVPDVLELGADRIFLKRRERQRGTAQYERLGHRTITGTIAEAGLLFEVNFTDYLDTGIFLDHRDTRAWLRELSAEKRFLNLFGYTGTATVFAADGGASSSTTVDLSRTYLDWARRNLSLNALADARHEFVQADVLAWLDDAAAAGDSAYDLIFCDPPTFSTSKRMDTTFDVQRDHVGLLRSAAALLAEDGKLVFSTNRRKFALDADGLADAGISATDVTPRTIPKDFERRLPHHCYLIERA